jgi:hypothetical protein
MIDNFLSLVEANTHLKCTCSGWYAGACPFCGGRDRFVLHQGRDGWRWLCRHCGDGKYHDAAAYIMKRDKLTYTQALERLGAHFPLQSKQWPQAEPLPQPPLVYSPPSEDWQQQAFIELGAAMKNLDSSEEGQTYLYSRGISQASQLRFLLGFAMINGRSAVVIPHLLNINTIFSVKYRYLEGEPRYTSRKGSKPLLFGLLGCGFSETLAIIEGELNAISISQTRPMLDVVSPGSETVGAVAELALKNLARKYKRIICWFDDPEKAKKVSELVKISLTLRSPMVENVKYDANRMLREGVLDQLISNVE